MLRRRKLPPRIVCHSWS